MTTESIKVGRRVVEISKADKVLFPADGITKLDLANYYHRVASVMLPHVKGRPVSMRRFPDGVNKKGFIQKDVSQHFPAWVKRVTVDKEAGGKVTHVTCDNAETLVYLADQACITPDVWPSRKGKLRHPDEMIFDLDPPDGDFGLVRDAARALKEVLEEVGAPVETPLEWNALRDRRLHGGRYTIRNLFPRIERKGDPWAGIWRRGRTLGTARSRLDSLRSD